MGQGLIIIISVLTIGLQEEKVREVIPLQKLAYVAFLHFESDEWGGMAFLDSADAELVCSDLSSKLNLTGWYNIPAHHISCWDNEFLNTVKYSSGK